MKALTINESINNNKLIDYIIHGDNTSEDLNEAGSDGFVSRFKTLMKKGLITAGIISALLASNEVSAQQKDFIKKIIKTEQGITSTVQTTNKEKADKLVDKGYSLDSVTVVNVITDTIINKQIKGDTLSLKDNNPFESGGFNLSQEFKDKLQSSIDYIKAADVIFKIKIESSTDKQRVSDKLASKLESMGLSGDNAGLSRARMLTIKKLLTDNGIQDSIIKFDTKVEQGNETISQENRYVKVDFYVIEMQEVVSKIENQKSDTVYHLSKVLKNAKGENPPSIGKWIPKIPPIVLKSKVKNYCLINSEKAIKKFKQSRN